MPPKRKTSNKKVEPEKKQKEEEKDTRANRSNFRQLLCNRTQIDTIASKESNELIY